LLDFDFRCFGALKNYSGRNIVHNKLLNLKYLFKSFWSSIKLLFKLWRKKRKLKNFFFYSYFAFHFFFSFLDKHTVCEREKLFIQKVYPPLSLIKLNKLFLIFIERDECDVKKRPSVQFVMFYFSFQVEKFVWFEFWR
jgi:hypothetical protein